MRFGTIPIFIHHIDSRDRGGMSASHAEAGEASPSAADGRAPADI